MDEGRWMTKAERVGKEVLDGLEKGRERAIAAAKARSRQRAASIILLFNEDVAKGRPAWGRAGRIARKLSDPISESQVRRILRGLSSMHELPRQNTPITLDGGAS